VTDSASPHISESYFHAELEQVLTAPRLLRPPRGLEASPKSRGDAGHWRIANRLLRRVRDYSLVHETASDAVHAALELYDVDAPGLDPVSTAR
jgi:Holliday junction DNA helicase RuvB